MTADTTLEALNRAAYDDIYADPLVRGSYEVRNKVRVVQKLIRGLPRMPNAVLDIGFGTGSVIRLFPSEATRRVGIEPILVPIRMFFKMHSDEGFFGVAADAQALPFGDASFDAVIMSHVLEHLPDDLGSLREVHRVLRPGGYALVLVPCRDIGKNALHARHYRLNDLNLLVRRANLVPTMELSIGGKVIEFITVLVGQLASHVRIYRRTTPQSSGAPGSRTLRRMYHRVGVPLLLGLSRLDDTLAWLGGDPLEAALLARREERTVLLTASDPTRTETKDSRGL